MSIHHLEARPIAVAHADCEVDVVAGEVDQAVVGADADVDIRVAGAELALDAGRHQPGSPVLAHVVVKQGVMGQILRPAERRVAVQQGGAADRKQVFVHQLDHLEARPIAVAHADCEVDVVAGEVDQAVVGADADVDIRVAGAELGEPAEQPLGRERWYGADGQGSA